jgi:hypothetical protein
MPNDKPIPSKRIFIGDKSAPTGGYSVLGRFFPSLVRRNSKGA